MGILKKKDKKKNSKILKKDKVLHIGIETSKDTAESELLEKNALDENYASEDVICKADEEERKCEGESLLAFQLNEVKVLMESLQDLINSNTIISKKISKDNSKIIDEVKGLKDDVIKDKDEKILELKRTINSMKNKEKYMLKNIIHIVDQFDYIHSYAEESANVGLIENMYSVMKVVKRELSEIGIEEIASLGEQFSPLFHSCEGTVKDESKEKNEIIKVIKKGYKRDSEVIRPSKVVAVMNFDENNMD